MQDPKSSSSRTTTITKAGSSSQRSLVLAIVILAQVMVVVDYTIVQVALPSIGREFGVSVNGLQWIITAYGLTLAGFLMLSGRVGDIYGHKKLFIIGVIDRGPCSFRDCFDLCKSGSRTGRCDGFCDRTINSSRSLS
jgi:hypothetical protein